MVVSRLGARARLEPLGEGRMVLKDEIWFDGVSYTAEPGMLPRKV